MRVRPWLYARAVHEVASRRRNPILRGVARASSSYLRIYGNASYDLRLNGELRVLHCIAVERPEVIFDVGANVGDWSRLALEVMPGVPIHAFEVVPDTASVLRSRVGAGVTVNAFGLSDADSTAKIYLSSESEHSSAFPVGAASDARMIECEVRRGDDYAAERGIESIGLLKIDAEGMDHHVLRGFSGLLERRAVRVIQFEYGLANIPARTPLAETAGLLDSFGYVMGKVFPTTVEFRPYAPLDEDYMGPNYVAVRAADTALRTRLSGSPSRAGRRGRQQRA